MACPSPHASRDMHIVSISMHVARISSNFSRHCVLLALTCEPVCMCACVCVCGVRVRGQGGICGTRAGQWMQRTWHCSRGGRWWWYSISLTEVRSTIHIANLSIASLNIGHDLGVPSNLIFAVGCSRVPIFPQRRRAVGRGLPTNRSWGTPGKGESPDKPHGEVN